MVFDFFFPPAPPPRGWVPPKSTWDKVWDKIKATIEDKAKDFAESSSRGGQPWRQRLTMGQTA